jgi:plastocyanin
MSGVIAVAALALAYCSGSTSSTPTAPTPPTVQQPPPPATQSVSVNIVGTAGSQAYNPNPVNANAGDTLVFRNADSASHRIVLDDGSMDFGDIAPGAASRVYTVRSTSAVNFHCTNHPSMVGTINGSSVPPPCNDPYGYDCA